VIKAFDDGSYFVLVNNEEVEFSQTGNNLTIPYEAGNDTIEIVGSYAIPEFGTIAMIVLAVAIVSIIVITTKTTIYLFLVNDNICLFVVVNLRMIISTMTTAVF
jgi:predicted secreted protein with PEFG-CTERM motif